MFDIVICSFWTYIWRTLCYLEAQCPFLSGVNGTDDVTALSREELHQLASELRSEIVRGVRLGWGAFGLELRRKSN